MGFELHSYLTAGFLLTKTFGAHQPWFGQWDISLRYPTDLWPIHDQALSENYLRSELIWSATIKVMILGYLLAYAA